MEVCGAFGTGTGDALLSAPVGSWSIRTRLDLGPRLVVEGIWWFLSRSGQCELRSVGRAIGLPQLLPD